MSKSSKKSFVFYFEWQEVLMEYPAEVRLEVYDAIIEYAASGTLPELKPLAKMALSFIKNQIDYNNEKYTEITERRREAGKKGMESRWKDNNKNNKCYQGKTNITYNDNVIDNENDNVIDNNTKDVMEEELVEKGNDLPSTPAKATIDYQSIVDKFNSVLAPPLPRVVKLTEQRRVAIRNRIHEHGEDSVDVIIQNIASSDFLLGRTDSGWVCSFDWAFCPRNYVKILEGNYANSRSNHSEKQRANEYALQQFAANRSAREQGVADEVENPF